MGRLRTGFGQEDEDRLVEGAFQDLNNRIMQNALAAEQMGLSNLQFLGNYGLQRGNTYLDALAGLTASRAAQDAQNRASRRGFLGNVLGGLMSLGGIVFSDPRLKEASDEMTSAVDKLRRMSGYSFKYTDEARRMHPELPAGMTGGVMADEVERVMPDAVTRDQTGMGMVDYWKVVGLNVEAIKELDERLRALEGSRKRKGP